MMAVLKRSHMPNALLHGIQHKARCDLYPAPMNDILFYVAVALGSRQRHVCMPVRLSPGHCV